MVVLAVISIIAYGRCFGSEFVFDSHFIVGEDTRLRHFGAKEIWDIFSENYWWPSLYSSAYRPLSTLVLNIEYSVFGFGAKPAGYQFVNLLLHVLVACVAFRLLCKLGMRTLFAFAATAWFALHPYATEVIPNIVGLSDMLALLCILVGVHVYLDVLEGRREFGRGLLLWTFVGVAGLLSKESAISLIALVFWHACTLGWGRVCELWRSRWFSPGRCALISSAILVVLSSAIVPKLIHRDLDLGQMGDPTVVDNPLRGMSPFEARLNAFSILGSNMANCIVPVTISADYSYGEIELGNFPPTTGADWHVLLAAGGVVLSGVVGLALRRRWSAFSFAIGAVFINAMPTANILLLIGTIRGDRLVYPYILPVVICCGLIVHQAGGYWLKNLSRPFALSIQQGLVFVVAIFLCLLGCITNLKATDWRTNKGFWEAAYQTSPGSFKTKLGWGGAFKDEQDLAKRDEGVALMRQAVAQLAESPSQDVRDNDWALESLAYGISDRARYLIEKGNADAAHANILEAKAIFEKVVGLKAVRIVRLRELQRSAMSLAGRNIKNDSAVMALAEIQRYLGESSTAARLLEDNLDSNRFSPHYLRALARAKVDAGDWRQGMHYLLQALLLKPDDLSGSREAGWIITNHFLPTHAKAYAVETEKADEPGTLLNLDDAAVSSLAREAALSLLDALEEADLPSEKAVLLRRIRVDMGQSDWFYSEG